MCTEELAIYQAQIFSPPVVQIQTIMDEAKEADEAKGEAAP